MERGRRTDKILSTHQCLIQSHDRTDKTKAIFLVYRIYLLCSEFKKKKKKKESSCFQLSLVSAIDNDRQEEKASENRVYDNSCETGIKKKIRNFWGISTFPFQQINAPFIYIYLYFALVFIF